MSTNNETEDLTLVRRHLQHLEVIAAMRQGGVYVNRHTDCSPLHQPNGRFYTQGGMPKANFCLYTEPWQRQGTTDINLKASISLFSKPVQDMLTKLRQVLKVTRVVVYLHSKYEGKYCLMLLVRSENGIESWVQFLFEERYHQDDAKACKRLLGLS